MTDHQAELPAYEWTWFEDESRPHRGIYGVRRGSEVVCHTNAHKDGYERAKKIAEALNRGERIEQYLSPDERLKRFGTP